jgi:hypothetical protein
MEALAGRLKIEVGRIMVSVSQQAVRGAAQLRQAIKDSPANLWKVSDVTRYSKSFFGGSTQEPTKRTLTFTVDVTSMVKAATDEHETAFKNQVEEATFRANYFHALYVELMTMFAPANPKEANPFNFEFRNQNETYHLKVTFVYEV